jgi:hypothetical protein
MLQSGCHAQGLEGARGRDGAGASRAGSAKGSRSCAGTVRRCEAAGKDRAHVAPSRRPRGLRSLPRGDTRARDSSRPGRGALLGAHRGPLAPSALPADEARRGARAALERLSCRAAVVKYGRDETQAPPAPAPATKKRRKKKETDVTAAQEPAVNSPRTSLGAGIVKPVAARIDWAGRPSSGQASWRMSSPVLATGARAEGSSRTSTSRASSRPSPLAPRSAHRGASHRASTEPSAGRSSGLSLARPAPYGRRRVERAHGHVAKRVRRLFEP